MKKRNLSCSKFLLSLVLYIPFIIILHLILGIAPADVWDDLMKWSKKR